MIWREPRRNAFPYTTLFRSTEDTKAPTVVVSASSTTLAAGQTDTITFAFSEAVTGFDLSDVSVTGGTLSNLQRAKGHTTEFPARDTPAVRVQSERTKLAPPR